MGTFINNLIKTIKTMFKKLFNQIGDFLRNLFSDIVDIVETKAPKAVQAVQKIKEGIESNGSTIEWIISKTKTEKDDEIYALIKNHLPTVSKELATIEGLVEEGASDEEAMEAYLGYIESKAKAARAKEYIILASTILQAIITRRMPLEILIIATQKAYHLIFKNK